MTRTSSDAGLATGAFVAAAMLAVALAGGGFGGVALGVTTGLIWLLLAVLVLLGALPAREPTPGLVVAATSLLALLGLTLLSLGWTSSEGSGFTEAVRLAGYLGVFLLAGLLARRDRAAPTLAGLAAGAVLVALVALGSRLLGIGAGDAELVAELPTAAGRLSFPLGYWNALGALMALALPPLCWLAAHARSARPAGLALAGVPPLIAAAYLTSSRGAVLAAAIGLVVMVACAAERRRVIAATLVGLAASTPVVGVASLATGLIDSPGDGSPGRPELAALAALLAGVVFALLLGGRLIGPLARSRPLSIAPRPRYLLAAVGAALAIMIIATGPSALFDDLTAGNDAATSAGNDRATGLVSASGSGRAQIWDAAFGAFTEQPVRGIGAGGFADYWNQHRSGSAAAGNAHSEPVEVLAELGLAGFACLLGFVVVVLGCAIARVRRADPGEGAAAAAGLLAAAALSFTIDWTWQVPAVALPVLAMLGIGCGLAEPAWPASWSSLRSQRAVALVALMVAVPAIWAGTVLAAGSARLQQSADALAEGRLNDAAAAARQAAAVAPWASEPWLQLADAERAGDNLDASLAAAEEAIRRDPSSLRGWLLAADLQVQRGDGDAAAAYRARAVELGAPESAD